MDMDEIQKKTILELNNRYADYRTGEPSFHQHYRQVFASLLIKSNT